MSTTKFTRIILFYQIITLCVYFSQFYVHPVMGVRVFSKKDVLLYVKKIKIIECDTDGQCETNSQDNIFFLLLLVILYFCLTCSHDPCVARSVLVIRRIIQMAFKEVVC
jgi:hypothetical protein